MKVKKKSKTELTYEICDAMANFIYKCAPIGFGVQAFAIMYMSGRIEEARAMLETYMKSIEVNITGGENEQT